MINKRFFVIAVSVLMSCASMMAEKSELHQRAETEEARQNVANARSLYIRAFEGHVGKGQMADGVACGVKATSLYYKETSNSCVRLTSLSKAAKSLIRLPSAIRPPRSVCRCICA